MAARTPRFLKLLVGLALVGSLSACAVYPAGGRGYSHGGGYHGRPAYAYGPSAYGPSRGGWRGGDGQGGGWASRRGWR